MDVSFMFPCLVIGAALITFTGFHVTLGHWIHRLADKWFAVETNTNHQEQMTEEVVGQDKGDGKGIAFWTMFLVILALLVLTIVLIAAVFIVGVLYWSLPSELR
jgi:hypothetical protein